MMGHTMKLIGIITLMALGLFVSLLLGSMAYVWSYAQVYGKKHHPPPNTIEADQRIIYFAPDGDVRWRHKNNKEEFVNVE